MQRATRHSILLVEANPSLRRMITLGLRHRGLHSIEANAPASFPISPSTQPDLVVLDIDGETAYGQALLSQVEAHPVLSTLPVVILTWESNIPPAMREEEMFGSAPARLFLSKPFDARALYTTIERLLLDVEESTAARKQEQYLVASRAAVAPSIWPLVTAIGFLLAMIGLMLQLTVTAIGLLVIITALLCWTLGPTHKPEPLPV
ncbi:MAG TPA: response regulator [Ktedonobacteraceae bacterium]